MISFHPSQLNRRLSASPAPGAPLARPGLSRPRQLTIANTRVSNTPSSSSSSARHLSSSSHTPRSSSVISHTASSSSSNPVQIRVNRPSLLSGHSPAPSTPVTKSAMKTTRETGSELSVGKRRLEEAAEDAAKHEVRADRASTSDLLSVGTSL